MASNHGNAIATLIVFSNGESDQTAAIPLDEVFTAEAKLSGPH
jgi:hypothetical protein